MGRLEADFRGDVALITGAAAGIGLAILRALWEAGATVHAFDLAEPDSDDLGRDVDSRVTFHRVDVRQTEGVERAVAEVFAAEGRIDLLVNNAGVTRDGVLWKLSDDDWRTVLDVNLDGCMRVLRSVASRMRGQGRGRIVQIASINGIRGKFGQTNYAASKAGLIGLTRAAARELGPRGITVNAVAPGMIETRMSRDLPDEVRERAVAETAVGRLGTPRDVAAAVLYLLSEDAAHTTGTVLRVDGGQLS